MTLAWAIILVLLNIFWLALVVIGLPGNWLMIISAVAFDWISGAPLFGRWTLLAVVGLALLGELLEFATGMAGSRSAGGSRRGAAGALVGGLLGGLAATFLIPIPVIGSILGACGGAFVGALGMELHSGRSIGASIRSGIGAGKGRFYGTIAKIMVGVSIWFTIAIAAFWP